jgi:hypothetical protein
MRSKPIVVVDTTSAAIEDTMVNRFGYRSTQQGHTFLPTE